MNDNPNLPTLAIAAHSPRADNFMRIFGRLNNIPIKTWTPVKAQLGELPMHALVYELDLERITADERRQLVLFIGVRYNADTTEIEKALALEGFPIVDGPDVIVAIPLRLLT